MRSTALTLLFLCASVSAEIIYVSPTGSTAGDGTVSAPYDSVQRGINEAVAGDTVVLEDGTYHEHDLCFKGKAITVGSRYVLDGDSSHREACIIDGDSSGSVINIAQAVDTSAVLAGITLTRGSGTGGYGGGVFFADAGWGLRFEQCVITGNGAGTGGGVYSGTCRFRSCDISGNTAVGRGGGFWRGSHYLDRCRINDNRVLSSHGWGGGFCDGTLVLSECVIARNMVMSDYGRGGGLYLGPSGEGSVVMRDCRIEQNTVMGEYGWGGGLYLETMGVYTHRFSRCNINNNSAYFGGAVVLCQREHPSFYRCTFTANTSPGADEWGTILIHQYSGQPCRYDHCIIDGKINTGPEGGGGELLFHYSLLSDALPGDIHQATGSAGSIIGLDPKLTNPAAGDVHLLANSPAIDAGHPDSSYASEPNCSGNNQGLDLGVYGNTSEATCAANNAVLAVTPASFDRSFYQHEIRWDELTVSNTGTDAMVLEDVKIVDAEIVFESWGTNVLNPGEQTTVTVCGQFDTPRTDTAGIQVVSNASNASVTVPYRFITLPQTGTQALIMPRGITFGAAKLAQPTVKLFDIRNNGANTIVIDSVVLVDPEEFFTMATVRNRTLNGQGTLSLSIAFEPVAEQTYTAALLVYSAYYNGVDTISLQGTGADIDDPKAMIDASLPDSVTWGETIDFIDGGSTDMDEVGPQTPVRYVWTCGSDTIGIQANINNYPADSFAIGANIITLAVMDNESTWSAPVSDTFHLKGLSPVVDSIVCNTGLILSTHPTDTLTAFASDRDEFATRNVNDGDLAAIEWHSSIDGLLGTGMSYIMTPGDLSLGTHGFVCKVTDDEGDVAYSDTLWIPVQTAIGRAVLVAGTAFDDYPYFFNNINPNVNWAYKKLRDRGFTDEQIHYMNPVGWQSIGDPYVNDGIVDETELTKDKLHTHLTGLKSDVQNNVPLVLVFIGHGNAADQDGKFYLNNDEYLTPDDLGGWLDEYEDLDMEHSSITVILDFCYSGTFINKLRTIYDQNRYIVTASDDANAAYFVNGKSFSWNIFNQVYRGKSLKRAFESAKSWSDANAPGSNPANPRLNCNGNSASNEAIDFSLADKVYIGGSQELQAVVPEIVSAVGSVYVTGASTDSVRLAVTTSGEVANLWVRVIGPDFTMGSSIQDQPLVPFASTGVNSWAAVDTRYFVADEYLYLIEGADAAGNGLLGQGIPVSVEYSSAVTRYPGAVVTGAVTVQTQMYDGRTEFMVNGGVPGMVIRICRSDGSSATAIPVPVNGRCIWDGADREGRRIEDAVYFYSVDGPAGRVSGQFLFIR